MQRRHSRRALLWLKAELEAWKREGIVSQEQSERIGNRYGLSAIEAKAVPSKLAAVISIIGAVLVGAGVILLVASNWEAIPRPVKLCMIFFTVFVVNHFDGKLYLAVDLRAEEVFGEPSSEIHPSGPPALQARVSGAL